MKGLIKVQFQRRRANKTDYVARARFLEGGLPRLIIRKSNRYLIAQIVESKFAQDKVILAVTSKELLKYGWPPSQSIKNLVAGYLLGVLCAAKSKKHKIGKVIVDIGLQRSTKGNKLYAVVKGAVDGGLEVPHSKEVVPSDERLSGKSLKNKIDVQKIKETILKKNG